MSDTISPSVTSRVPCGRNAVGRHGGPPKRRSPLQLYYRRATVDAPLVAARRCDKPPPLRGPIPRLKPWVFWEGSITTVAGLTILEASGP